MHVDCLCCQGYDSVVGNVRKACVYCLVALHEAVGEAVLQPYLSHVSETKVKGLGTGEKATTVSLKTLVPAMNFI